MTNNPGNLRSSSGDFQSFDSPEEGLAAMKNDLLTKVSGKSQAMASNYGADYTPTLNTVISTYAPPTENNTPNYINYVSKKSGIDPNTPLKAGDVDKIIPHMVKMEGGKMEPTDDQIFDAAAQKQPSDEDIFDSAMQKHQGKEPSDDNSLFDSAKQGQEIKTKQEASKPEPKPISPLESIRNKLATPIALVMGSEPSIGAGVLQGINNVGQHIPGFTSDAEKRANIDTNAKYKAQYGNDRAASIGEAGGEMLATAPLLMTGNELTAAIPKVGEFLAGTGGGNLLTKGISAGTNGALNTAGFNALTGRPQTPESLATGAVMGVAARGIGSAMTPEEEAASSGELKSMATGKYKEATAKGGILSPDFTDKMVNYVEGQKPTSALGLATGKNDPALELSKVLKDFKGKPLDLQSIQEFDENLGDQITMAMKDGRATPESNKLSTIQRGIRDMVNKAGPGDLGAGSTKEGFEALQDARKLWSGYTKMRDLENIQARAELANNPVQAAKTAYKNLYLSAKKSRGYSEDELALIKKASQTGVATNALNLIGSRLIPMISGATGGIPGAVGGFAASEMARNAAGKMQAGRGQAIAKQVAKNALTNAPQATSATYINKLLQSALPSLGSQAVSRP